MPQIPMVTMSRSDAPILTVRDLRVTFPTRHGHVHVVDGLDLSLHRGRTLGIVGESGCGKSMTARAILGITPDPGRISAGQILFDGGDGPIDLAALPIDGSEIRSLRGDRIAMIFQEPMTSFSPVHTIGSQIVEAVRLHRNVSAQDGWHRAGDLLERVGIADPRSRLSSYPFQMSGGMRQRAMIAMALACDPDILIADEPTTALDVTIQAQILGLLAELQAETGMAIMLITHNFGVIAQACHDVAVLYLGRAVEEGPVADILSNPLHPYTRGLLNSIPTLGRPRRAGFEPIKGAVPGPGETVAGCPFHPRCAEIVDDRCGASVPALATVAPGRQARCFLHSAKTEGGGA
jgi:peptide/nickel transport system ATP-binding protein